jgi:hypothetical protein
MQRGKTYIIVSSIDKQTRASMKKPWTTMVAWIALVYLYASLAAVKHERGCG